MTVIPQTNANGSITANVINESSNFLEPNVINQRDASTVYVVVDGGEDQDIYQTVLASSNSVTLSYLSEQG